MRTEVALYSEKIHNIGLPYCRFQFLQDNFQKNDAAYKINCLTNTK